MLGMDTLRTYTRQEAAEILQISAATVSRLVKRGQLRGARVGRQLRIPAEALAALAEGRPQPERLAPGRLDGTDYSVDLPTPSLYEGGQ